MTLSNASPKPVIVFDLDGTLIDSAPDLIATLNTILAREKLPPLPMVQARKLIGGGARKLIERGLALENRSAPPADLDRMVADFIAHYAENIAVHSRPFEGAIAALDRLEASGFTFAICTNKLEWLSRKLMDTLNLSSRFAAICGPDTFGGVAKPKPDGLLQTIERAGGRAPAAIMVGDSFPDIGAARAAGIPVVAVDFGYTETPVRQLDPDLVISHFDELPASIGKLWASIEKVK